MILDVFHLVCLFQRWAANEAPKRIPRHHPCGESVLPSTLLDLHTKFRILILSFCHRLLRHHILDDPRVTTGMQVLTVSQRQDVIRTLLNQTIAIQQSMRTLRNRRIVIQAHFVNIDSIPKDMDLTMNLASSERSPSVKPQSPRFLNNETLVVRNRPLRPLISRLKKASIVQWE